MTQRNIEILFASSILVILVGTAWFLHFNGLYGQDSHEYLRFARELRSSLLSGQSPGPFFWPVYYPLIGAITGLLVPNLILVMQGISMAALGFSGFFLVRSLRLLYQANKLRPLLFVGLFFIGSPYIFRSGLVVMSEMLSVFFICGAIYFWLRYRPQQQLKDLLLFVGFGCAATLTRSNALLILLPFIVLVTIDLVRHFKVGHIAASIVVVVICLLPELLLHKSMEGAGLQHYLLQGWSFTNFFHSDFNLADGHLQYALPNFIYAFEYLFHPGFTLLGLPLLLFLKKENLRNISLLVIMSSILIYTIFLMGIPNQNV